MPKGYLANGEVKIPEVSDAINIIYACLMTLYPDAKEGQPCFAPLCGFGVDTPSNPDKISPGRHVLEGLNL